MNILIFLVLFEMLFCRVTSTKKFPNRVRIVNRTTRKLKTKRRKRMMIPMRRGPMMMTMMMAAEMVMVRKAVARSQTTKVSI